MLDAVYIIWFSWAFFVDFMINSVSGFGIIKFIILNGYELCNLLTSKRFKKQYNILTSS